MKRKKKQIICVATGLPCEWYKKGRNHRVLVRADGVVLANNPAPLAALAAIGGKKALTKALATGALSGLGGVAISKLFNRKEKKRSTRDEDDITEGKQEIDFKDIANPESTAGLYAELVAKR